MNHIKNLLEGKGYDCLKDNRDYYTRTLNKILEDGLLKIKIAPKGKVFIPKEGHNYQVYIGIVGEKTGKTYWSKLKYGGYRQEITPYILLGYVGTFLKGKKHDLKFHYSEQVECAKCQGTGFLPHYAHILNGVCFDCYGLGVKLQKTTTEV